MAIRPVFMPNSQGVRSIEVEFEWFPGFSPSQKKKSIQSLHNSFKKLDSSMKVLEISSKSEESLGISLSAFNLETIFNGTAIPFEALFQGSKIFEKGGPYTDIYLKSARDAKRDERLKNSGEVIGFEFQGKQWSNSPKTYFYDWMYIKIVCEKENLLEKVIEYGAFTDIEFNPKKSVNCQARAAALLVSVYRNGEISLVLKDPSQLLSYYESEKIKRKETNKEGSEQITFNFES